MARGQITGQHVIIREVANYQAEGEKIVKEVVDMMTRSEQEKFPGSVRIRLVLKHSRLMVYEIEQIIGFRSTNSCNVGEARITPAGTLLDGMYPETVVTYSQIFEDSRDFFENILSFINEFKIKPCSIESIISSGGRAFFCIDLCGSFNFGSIISEEGLIFLSRYKIDVGVEFFPDCVSF
jgi:hypothetical protein